MLQLGGMNVAAVLVALLPVGGAITAGSAVLRTNLRQASAKTQEELASCDCTRCLGERRNEGGDGTVGFQCFPGQEGLEDCRQTEDPKEWAVQSAEVLSYDRFCMYTCKPELSNKIEPQVSCKRLSWEEISLQAQSPSFNGKEIVYQAHPMTPVGPISRLVPMPEAAMIGVGSAAAKSGDPVGTIKDAFATIRKQEAEEQGPSPFDLPPSAKAPPLCVCHCGNEKVNRFRKKPGGPHGVVYPKPAKMGVPASVTSAGVSLGKDAEPPQPPMPPPPPPPLPPPMMPMGMGPMLTELPTVPEAPPEVFGPLDLPPVAHAAAPGPAPAAAASPAASGGDVVVSTLGNMANVASTFGKLAPSFLQEAASPIACNCVC